MMRNNQPLMEGRRASKPERAMHFLVHLVRKYASNMRKKQGRLGWDCKDNNTPIENQCHIQSSNYFDSYR